MISRNLVLRSIGPTVDQLTPRLRPARLRPGQVIGEPGQIIERVFFPTSGLISLQVPLQTGRHFEAALVGHTGATGLMAALGSDAGLAYQICLVEADVWTMSVSDLRAAILSIPGLETSLKPFLFRQMNYAGRVGVCNAAHTAEQRVARWLLIAVGLLQTGELRIAQEELSKGLGLQRSAVNPILQKLKAQRLIEASRGRIAVLNPDALQRHACECYASLREWSAAEIRDPRLTENEAASA